MRTGNTFRILDGLKAGAWGDFIEKRGQGYNQTKAQQTNILRCLVCSSPSATSSPSRMKDVNAQFTETSCENSYRYRQPEQAFFVDVVVWGKRGPQFVICILTRVGR